jgi:hypothetical protein
MMIRAARSTAMLRPLAPLLASRTLANMPTFHVTSFVPLWRTPLPVPSMLTLADKLTTIIRNGLWLISTIKRRKAKMNKHKLKKRRKLLRKNTKISRG